MSAIIIDDLHKSYGDIRAVDGVGFEVGQGEIFGLLGPNGAGKTTFISMLCCLLEPTSGTAMIDSKDLSKDGMSIRRVIGVVPQEVSLYPALSAYDNLKFYGKMYDVSGDELEERIEKLLKIVGLEGRARDLIKTYSGGMKRRINLAAALIHNPKVLLLDEPTLGLDPQTRIKIHELIKKLNEDGVTILLTTHYMDEAEKLCNRVGIMDNGRIVAIDTVERLLELVGGIDIIDVEAEEIPSVLMERISKMKGVEKVSRHSRGLHIETMNGRELLPKIVTEISSSGVEIKSVQIKEPNLESVFIHLTGKELRD